MPNLTTIADWAKSLGISRQSAYDAVKRCEIPMIDGKVDEEYATVLYRRHTRARAGGKASAPSLAQNSGGIPAAPGADMPSDLPADAKVTYESARARREAAEAAIAEMREAEMSGKYLVKAEVDAAVFEIARALRDGLTNCARRIAADVAGMSDADECEKVIELEHRQLLEGLVRAFEEKVDISVEGISA